MDHAVLVEQREPALDLQHALDHEHHVRPPGIVFVEDEGAGMLQRPGQDAFSEFRDLLAVLQDDGILPDEVDAADVAIEVDAEARPVQPRGHLLDMGRLARPVIALDHDAPVEGEAGEDREGRIMVELVGRIDLWHVVRTLAEGRRCEVGFKAEDIAHADLYVRRAERACAPAGRDPGIGAIHHRKERPVMLRSD